MTETNSSWNQHQLRLHGYFALGAFILVLPLSAIVVALGSHWDLWIMAHVFLVALGAGLAIASIALGILGSDTHLTTTHQILGTIVSALMIVTVLSGTYISIYWRPSRSLTPKRDRAHWWMGRGLIILSYLLCIQGLVTAAWTIWAYVAVIASWFLWVAIYGLFLADTSGAGPSVEAQRMVDEGV